MPNQIPQSAFRFLADEPTFERSTGNGQRRFAGVAYTGNPLIHPYWGQVVFDVSSTCAAAEKTPILIDHDSGKRAGFASIDCSENQIRIADGVLMSNVHGTAVAEESDHGFPWQMSVFIDPGKIEELLAGSSETVNGREITGPAIIFRNSIIREVSFTATGVDYQTSATALSVQSRTPTHEEMTMPKPDEQQADAIAALQNEIDGLKASVAAEKGRADSAEAALREHQAEVRMSAVKTLFSETGKTFSEEAAKPYLAMDEATFAAVSQDIKSVKPQAPDHMFQHQANDGAEPPPQTPPNDGGNAFNLNKIYGARRAN